MEQRDEKKMEEFTEPSLLDYARFHGVASPTLPSSDLTEYISPDTLESLESSLQHPDASDLQTEISTAAAQITSKQKERLQIERDGAIFLSSIVKPPAQQPPLYPPSTNRHRVRNMKIDPPLLQSDHELDLLAFSSGKISIDPSELDLPFEKLEVENDEALEWPLYYMDFPAQVWERVRTEKLDCAKEVLLYIQEIRNVGWDGNGVGAGEVVRVKEKVIEPLTPPLLPLEPERGLFVPSSPAGRLEILSEPETPPIKEHVECERKVTEMDSIEVDDGESTDRMLSEFVEFGDGDSQHHAGTGELSTWKRVRGDDLKVEGPITPPISAKKRRAEEDGKPISEILADNAPELLCQPPDAEIPDGEILDGHLVEIAQAAMSKIDARLNNEHMRQVNPTTRVQVPDLDSAAIIPPWKASKRSMEMGSKDSRKDFITSTITDHLGNTPCPMETKTERSLEWVPFSLQRSYVDVDEKIGNDDRLELVQAPDAGDCNGLDGLLGRLGGLRILEEGDDYDEELSPMNTFPDALSGSSTVLGVSTSNENTDIIEKWKHPSEVKQKKKLDIANEGNPKESAREAKRQLPLLAPEVPLFQSGFSTTNSLSNFMEIRGHDTKRRKVESSPYFRTFREEAEPHEPTKEQTPEKPDNLPIPPANGVESIPTAPLPFPDIASTAEMLTLVLSIELLKTHRLVIQHLESMDRKHRLIYRDYGQYSQAKKKRPQNLNRYTDPASRTISDETEDLGQEADIILSPSTAILLTTSQATTQRYLPGHRSRNAQRGSFDSPLRERIARTCVPYEQLYVLICHPSSFIKTRTPLISNLDNPEPTSMTIDTPTANSIRSLVSFSSSLSLVASVTPLIVPYEPSELMKWITSLAYKHALQSLPIPAQLQEEETTSELFLRRAGLNPFAAQYILSTMTDGSDGDGRSSSLTTFVNMDPRERRQRFVAVIGERLFSRVERRLEMRWDFV